MKHSKLQNANRLPARVYGDGMDAQHRPKNCEGVARCAIFAAHRPALRRNRADLFRAVCPLVREPPESCEGEVGG